MPLYMGAKMEIRGAKSQLGWILGLYRVTLLILKINAYMFIFISKLTEITRILEIPEKLIS